jgi:hypothetical protein
MRAVLAVLIISMSGCSLLIDLPNLECDALPPEGCDRERVLNTTKPSEQDEPAVAAGRESFLVVFEDESQSLPDTSGSSIRGRLLDACGEPQEADFVLNQITTGDQLTPRIAAGPDNRYFVVWNTLTSSVHGRIVALDGSTDFLELSLATAVGAKQNPAIASTSELPGIYLVAWQHLSVGVHGRFFDADGNGLGPDFLIGEDSQDHEIYISVAHVRDNQFFVVWSAGVATTVVGRFVSTGPVLGDTEDLSTPVDLTGPEPSVAVGDEKILVVWVREDREVLGRFITDGKPEPQELVLSEGVTEKGRASVTALPGSSSFFVIWEERRELPDDDDDVRGRLVTTDGSLEEIRTMNRITQSDQKEPALATGPTGIIVAWADRSQLIPDQTDEAIRFTFLPRGTTCPLVQ